MDVGKIIFYIRSNKRNDRHKFIKLKIKLHLKICRKS